MNRVYTGLASLVIISCSTLVCAQRDSSDDWSVLEQVTQNTVVQVWSQKAKFNWLEPYKSPEHSQSAGTAFFINEKGYLLSNFHVVDEAKSVFINVPAYGRKLLEVVIVGVCPESDVALLKLTDESIALIESTLGKIPYLELGDSDDLYATEPVLALGYPLGQRYLKSTVGVIAGREYIGGQSYMHITAPINPGNSGGPLLNRRGEVVGINSAGIEKAQNIGYIIPINNVKILLPDLYTIKLLRKPYLGAGSNHTTEEHAKSLHNPLPAGVYINYVQENSLTDKLGIKQGDMLYTIDYAGERYLIDEYGDVTVQWRGSDKITLAEFLMRIPKGERVALMLYRNGQQIELECAFDISSLYPIRLIYPDYEPQEIDYEMFGGIIIMQLRDNHFKLLPPTSLMRQYMRLDYQPTQVLVVTHILPGSALHKIDCLYPGCFIDTINGQVVTTLEQLREALLKSIDSKEIAITTKENIATVISLEKIVIDEPRLARDFRFPITETVKKLWQGYSHNT